jgi:Reverse transcriptase (RNA-dependent DNA polymerase)
MRRSHSLGNLYYLTFIDECTRYSWVYPVPNKKAATIKEKFLKWKAEAENFSGCKVKHLRTDGGGEYEREVKKFLHETGIIHQPTPAYAHESNGMAERLNRTLNEMARAMLIQANMPQQFWDEAIQTAAYVKNMLPHAFFGPDSTSPYERWHNTSPPFDTLRPFGCTVYATIPPERRPPRTKYLKRANIGCIIRPVSSSSYRYFDFLRNCFDDTHDYLIKEDQFPTADDFKNIKNLNQLLAPPSEVSPFPSIVPNDSAPHSTPHSAPPSADATPRRIYDTIVVLPRPKPKAKTALLASSEPTYEPQSFDDAIACPDAKEWIEAMKDEMKSMVENKAFALCDLPPRRKCIGCKWVFKIKRDALDRFERLRARLVAKGYSQVLHLDFEKTYALVVHIDSIRHIFALAAYYNLHMLHADAKTAFINGQSDVELYLQQVPGFVDANNPHKVLKLNRSLYGMKQACRIWYLLLCQTIMEFGFEMLKSDECVFISQERRMILLVYVDDILILGPDQSLCLKIYNYLAQHFMMNNLGPPTSFLGMNIVRNVIDRSLTLDQSGYIQRMLADFQMEDAKPADTPLDASLPLCSRQPHEKQADQELYQQITGSLNHLAVYTRPDISFAVSRLSQFNRDPSTIHTAAAKRVLRYLKSTIDFKIHYGGGLSHKNGGNNGFGFYGFADASHGGDFDDGKSHTGYVFLLNNGPITWTSHKQISVASSTIESEYMSLSDASREAIARHQLFEELGIQLINPPALLSDNQGALAITEEPAQHHKTKHIRVRYHFIRDAYRQELISIGYVPSTDQAADILTKALHSPAHSRHCTALGLF